MMPPACAIHPKGPPMLVSLVTGARRFANRILDKFPNKSSPVQDVGSVVAHRHEGSGAHGVASVEELLLPGHLEDLLDHAWYVILGHLIPSEFPEFIVEPAVWVGQVMAAAGLDRMRVLGRFPIAKGPCAWQRASPS